MVDWNQNGAVRFDIAALNYATVEPGAWSVMKFDDTVHVSSGRCLEPAAITYRTSAGSGSIVVNVDRLGGRDLRAIIAHELGVASGNGDPERSPSCGASAVR